MEKKTTRFNTFAVLEELKDFATKIHNSYNSDVIALRKELIANNGENIGKLLGMENMLSKKYEALREKIDELGAKFVACQDGWNKKFELCTKEREAEREVTAKQIEKIIESVSAFLKTNEEYVSAMGEKIIFLQKILVLIGVVGGVLTAMLLYHLLTLL